MTTRVLTEAELIRRRPVWIALSDLWLDTELDESRLKQIAQVAAESGYSDDELKQIYLLEVAPVVCSNSRSVAGVWDGFDEEWLCEKAKIQAETQPWFPRFMVSIGLGKIHLTWPTDRDWKRVLTFLDKAR